jgi:hypothetical protein
MSKHLLVAILYEGVINAKDIEVSAFLPSYPKGYAGSDARTAVPVLSGRC